MKARALFAAMLATAVSTSAIGQVPAGEIDTHIAAAKTAAGLDYRATFVNSQPAARWRTWRGGPLDAAARARPGHLVCLSLSGV